MKPIFSLLTPTATIAAIFISGMTPAPAQELVATSIINSAVVQRSPESLNQQLELPPPPVDGRPDGRPDGRTPAGSRFAQPPETFW